jgi:hypothetical protein
MKLFGVAIKLAYSSNYDVAKIMDIYKVHLQRRPQLQLPAQASCQMIVVAIVSPPPPPLTSCGML